MNANLKNKKTITLLATVAVLAVALISFTLAMLNQRSQAATNNFSGATVNIGVVENGKTYEDGIDDKNVNNGYDKVTKDQEVAKTVAIKNIYDEDYPTSDTYVRVRLVPCFRYDDNVENYGGQLVPIDMNEKVTYSNLGENWVKWPQNASVDDAYYYYTLPLKPGQTTTDLIKTVTYTGDIPENAHFELQVLTEGVSAKQENAAKKAWGESIPALTPPAPAADTTSN